MRTDRARLLLGSANPGKLLELRALFGSLGPSLVSPADLHLRTDIRESGHDYEENARLKAAAYARAAGLWTIADDSGLEVEALDGAPGLYSARLAGEVGTDEDRRRRLLELLADEPRPWLARFVCTMVLATPTTALALTRGECLGEIVPEPRGAGGFGYDPIFQVAGTNRTMAQLASEEKNRISHRAHAAAAMRPLLLEFLEDRPDGENA
jgi:XTP/dITP diphosphohydrolase